MQKYLGKGDTVVDIGCGEPSLFNLMCNSMLFPSYVGVDIREEALLKFGNNKNVLVIRDDITSLQSLRTDAFGVAVFTEVLEHLSEDEGSSVLDNIRCILRDDGVLILTTPIKPVEVDIDMEIELSKWDHRTYYESDDLICYLACLGFGVIHKSYNKFIGRRVTYRKSREGIIDAYGTTGRDIFDRVAGVLTNRIAGAIFGDYAGDVGGHIQLVLRKL